MRRLSATFMNSLTSGILQPLLVLVKRDATLSMEIRENYINVYYRGGNLLRIEEKNGSFTSHFDEKYIDLTHCIIPKMLLSGLKIADNVSGWIESIHFIKHTMDLWFGKSPKNEREFQQLIVR